MSNKWIIGLSVCGIALTVAVVVAQGPTAAQLVPPGFKVTIDKSYGPAYMFEGTRANSSCPRPHMSQDIVVRGGWQPMPTVNQMIEMIAAQPEDPPSSMGATRNEPFGKERYRGGVLTWRKSTTPWIGSSQGPDMVMVSGAWAGPGAGMMLGAGVERYCGSKEEARAWIDQMIDKLSTVK